MEKMQDRKEAMNRIGRVRRASGLTHAEFARTLNMPAWQVDIAERGVVYCRNHNETAMVEHFFTDREFDQLLQDIAMAHSLPLDWLRYGRGHVDLDETNAPDDELEFYFPLTLSCQSMMEDLKKFRDTFEPSHAIGNERRIMECEGMDLLITKFRAYFSCLNQIGKAETARMLGTQMLEFCKR